jgi:hypothetical protein
MEQLLTKTMEIARTEKCDSDDLLLGHHESGDFFFHLGNSTHSPMLTTSCEPHRKWVVRMCNSTDVPGPCIG